MFVFVSLSLSLSCHRRSRLFVFVCGELLFCFGQAGFNGKTGEEWVCWLILLVLIVWLSRAYFRTAETTTFTIPQNNTKTKHANTLVQQSQNMHCRSPLFCKFMGRVHSLATAWIPSIQCSTPPAGKSTSLLSPYKHRKTRSKLAVSFGAKENAAKAQWRLQDIQRCPAPTLQSPSSNEGPVEASCPSALASGAGRPGHRCDSCSARSRGA